MKALWERLNPVWLARMAWRDSRSHRGRLLLFVSSISLGIGSLVAVGTLSAAMEKSVDDQANTLLGADLEISSRSPFSQAARSLFSELGGRQSEQARFSSMAYFSGGRGRLVQVRTLGSGFPYYGSLETTPSDAPRRLAEEAAALVDETLMIQFGAAVGDSIRVGALDFLIAGRLLKIPGETPMAASLEPRVFIPEQYLAATRLVQRGSRISYRRFFKFPDGADIETILKQTEPKVEALHLRSQTVAGRKRSIGRPLTHLYRFLNLGSFIALLLGSVGVASSVHTYIKQKLNTVAVLRSLGASTAQTLSLYLFQALMMGLVGSIAGVVAGVAVTLVLPSVVSDVLPLDIELGLHSLSLSAMVRGVVVGMGMACAFALLPLLKVRRVSPLLALRKSYEESGESSRDPLQWVVLAVIGVGIGGFAASQTRLWHHGLSFAGGLIVAFGVLSLMAGLVVYCARRFLPQSWSYIARQGLANLYRPNNQTTMLVLALGLGTFLIATLYLLQSALLKDLTSAVEGDQPNLVLIDIQSDQVEGVAQLVETHQADILQRVPVVSMRLSQVRGRSVQELRENPGPGQSRWALNRDYRCTYRAQLTDSETLIQGQWVGAARGDTVFVSLDEGIARGLSAKLGDELVFDVHGVPVTAVVGSIREVNWRRVRPNFLVVFPTGVLEQAPQFHVFVIRTHGSDHEADTAVSSAMRAELQRAVTDEFPNVSSVDLDLILTTVNSILDKATLVIRFLALFSVGTGLVVLVGVITSNRYQHILESVLLRTLGATRRQVVLIMVLEYVFLGALAALNGLALASLATLGLTRFLFEVSFTPSWPPVVAVAGLVIGLTVMVGLLGSRGIHNRAPLEVLRST